ncbi:MAG: AEC family transporter, partial [Oscillospiraceae bacterium]
MNSFYKMVNVQSVLFIYLLVGFFCRKTDLFDDKTRSKLTDFTILITLPCMVFDSFHMPFSLETLKQGGTAILIATVMAAVALLLGKVLYNRFEHKEKCIMQYGTLVTNSGF